MPDPGEGDARSMRDTELSAITRVAEAVGAAPDLETFLACASEQIVAVCGAATVAFFLVDRDVGQTTLLHFHGGDEEARRLLSRAPIEGSSFGAAATLGTLTARLTAELRAEAREAAERLGLVEVAALPVRFRSSVVAVMGLGFRAGHDARRCRTEVVSALGAHVGAAIETHRLLDDLRGRVADLEAVNALALRMFAIAPGDEQALLDMATREIVRALSARSAVVLRLDAGGTRLEGVSGFGTPLPPAELAIPLARSDAARRALETQQPVCTLHVFDRVAPGEKAPPSLSLLLVPLTSRRTTRALVAIADAPERRFSDAEVALASALASEAAMGMENAGLYADARRRVEDLSLINEVGRAVAGSLELDRILAEGARAVTRLVEATTCNVMLLEDGELRWSASTLASDSVLLDLRMPLTGRSLAAQVVRERRPIAVEDVLASDIVDVELARRRGIRAIVGAPLLVHDHPVGVLEVAEHRSPRRFTAAEIERIVAIANQLAVAIDNARLYEDLRRSYADLAQAQDQLVHRERLAALGELAAVVAHEVRNPLGVIFNSLGSLRRLFRPGGDALLLFDMAQEEADRLNRIVGDLLDFARPSTPTLHPEPLDRVLEEAVAVALADAPRGIAVRHEVAPGLPLVPMDARLLRQAIVNVAANAVQAMPGGGTLTVGARVAGDSAVVELRDTGPGIPHEARQRIFEPFFTTKATGTGLGLAVVKRIVDGHHGRVEVETPASGGVAFVIHLPLTAADQATAGIRQRRDRG